MRCLRCEQNVSDEEVFKHLLTNYCFDCEWERKQERIARKRDVGIVEGDALVINVDRLYRDYAIEADIPEYAEAIEKIIMESPKPVMILTGKAPQWIYLVVMNEVVECKNSDNLSTFPKMYPDKLILRTPKKDVVIFDET